MFESFWTYMTHQGILQQSLCVDTPSQNGMAERKNGHLLETIHILLSQTKVLKQLSVDAISITYCMPSMVINDDIPYNVLFPNKPLFPLDLWVFSSTCYVHDAQSHIIKLDPKTLKYAFLGYSRL